MENDFPLFLGKIMVGYYWNSEAIQLTEIAGMENYECLNILNRK